MACGIVSVASAVTTNTEIIRHGVNGFLVWQEGDWERVLREVLDYKERFEEIGSNARETVASRYSFDAYGAEYAGFVARLSRRGKGLSFGSRGRPLEGNASPNGSKADFSA
jgi:glycosyltransferase involved in cell wall biosynthesis